MLGWARRSTRGLPAPAAGRRVEELASDCHEHRGRGREVGAPDWAVTVSMATRTLAGIRLRRRRRVLGDVLIGIGVLPLVPWWWTWILPLLALAVVIPAFVDAAAAQNEGEASGSARPA